MRSARAGARAARFWKNCGSIPTRTVRTTQGFARKGTKLTDDIAGLGRGDATLHAGEEVRPLGLPGFGCGQLDSFQ